jgi:hypothetical protein
LMLWLGFETEKSGFGVYTIPILRRPLDNVNFTIPEYSIVFL